MWYNLVTYHTPPIEAPNTVDIQAAVAIEETNVKKKKKAEARLKDVLKVK